MSAKMAEVSQLQPAFSRVCSGVLYRFNIQKKAQESLPSKSLSAKLGLIYPGQNEDKHKTGDRLGDHWGTHAFWELAVII